MRGSMAIAAQNEPPGYCGLASKMADCAGSRRNRAARNAIAASFPPPTASDQNRRGSARRKSHQ